MMKWEKYLPKQKSGHEYAIVVEWTLKEKTDWAEKGHVIASNQLVLGNLVEIEPKPSKGELQVNAEDFDVTGEDFKVGFDQSTGALVSFSYKGKEQVLSQLVPNFTRPLTDNDRKGWKAHKKLKEWYEVDLSLVDMSKIVDENGVQIASSYSLVNGAAELKVKYRIHPNGLIKVDYELQANDSLPNIPSIGMQMGIPDTYDKMNWFGRGPLENYVDRRYGFDARVYSAGLGEVNEPYPMPQERGNLTDVRWMLLSDGQDNGLLIVADSLLSMSCWRYTEKNINKAKHTYDLVSPGYHTLNIDLVQMGVGGNDSWSDVAAPLEKYQIPAGDYAYSFYMIPKDGSTKNVEQLRAQYFKQ